MTAGLHEIIFGDALLYFTNQIGADIRRFCVDTTTYTSKEGNAAGAKAKAGDVANLVGVTIEKQIEEGQCQPG